jgi:hypothetical protein
VLVFTLVRVETTRGCAALPDVGHLV